MRYDIEADWSLLDACNYRCGYCFHSPERLGQKVRTSGRPEDWRSSFDATGLTWLLHMTGGEPTIYPDFAGLCELLSDKHFLSLNSNLSRKSILEFARRVDPARVSFINAGLHPRERELRNGLSSFLHHASALCERNFRLMISIVATPDVLARFDRIAALTKPSGLALVPKLLRGSFNGREYPKAYTAEERRLFREFSARANAAYAAMLTVTADRPSIDMFSDADSLYSEPRFRGRMCAAGSKFVSIAADGSVYRCQQTSRLHLGNILAGTFAPRPGPAPCDAAYCMYFCLKYASGPRRARLSDRVMAAWHDGWTLLRRSARASSDCSAALAEAAPRP